MKALFGYFGRMFDHDVNIPSHPLYQLFLLHSLAKEYKIDKFDIHYYDTVYDYKTPKYHVLPEIREDLYDKLVDKDNVSLEEVLDTDYDILFLKNRFRNYSRLKDGSLDTYDFEQIYNKFKDKCIIIDTDEQVKKPYEHIVTYFNGKYDYPKGTGDVTKIIPVLEEDVLACIDSYFKSKLTFQLTYIGNEYFKEGIQDSFAELKKYYPELMIKVQGTWIKHPFIYEVISRKDRAYGYEQLASSPYTVQISKPVYLKSDFLAPRIFESLLLGTIIFSQNSFMPKFSKFTDLLELSEKMKFLDEINEDEYKKILITEVKELYKNLDNKS